MENNKPRRRKRQLINITNELDHMRLFYWSQREAIRNRRYDFRAKTISECLHCGDLIFINYNAYGRKAIFCEAHDNLNTQRTIVQMQYLKRIKDEQVKLLKLIDKGFSDFTLSDINGNEDDDDYDNDDN